MRTKIVITADERNYIFWKEDLELGVRIIGNEIKTRGL